MFAAQNFPLIAIFLASIAGFIDAVCFTILFNIFTANMSGNAIYFGLYASQGQFTESFRKIYPVIIYFLGAVSGTLILEIQQRLSPDKIRLSTLFLLQAILLSTFLIIDSFLPFSETLNKSGPRYFLLAALPTATMGLQAAGLRNVGDQNVRTTVITGMLTDFAKNLTSLFILLLKFPGKAVYHLLHPSAIYKKTIRKTAITGAIVTCYIAGALLGGFIQVYWSVKSLLIPISLLVIMVIWQLMVEFSPGYSSKSLDKEII